MVTGTVLDEEVKLKRPLLPINSKKRKKNPNKNTKNRIIQLLLIITYKNEVGVKKERWEHVMRRTND